MFLRDVFGIEDRLKADMIDVRDEKYFGDLAKIGSVTDIYKESTVYGIDGDKHDKTYGYSGSLDFIALCDFQPDIVVWEVVERNIRKYHDMKLIKEKGDNGEVMGITEERRLFFVPDASFEACSDGIRYMPEDAYVKDETYYFCNKGMAVTGWLEYNSNKEVMFLDNTQVL